MYYIDQHGTLYFVPEECVTKFMEYMNNEHEYVAIAKDEEIREGDVVYFGNEEEEEEE